jgi:hypothetical protein
VLSLFPDSPRNSLGYVPTGLPGAGTLKGINRRSGGFYTLGTNTNTLEVANIGNLPTGFVYMPSTSVGFSSGAELLIVERGSGAIYAHKLDANGNPIPATKELFISNFDKPMGILVDPVTGDILFDGSQQGVYLNKYRGNFSKIKVARGLGKLSDNEAGLKKWLVYADKNQDGIRQAGEEYAYRTHLTSSIKPLWRQRFSSTLLDE